MAAEEKVKAEAERQAGNLVGIGLRTPHYSALLAERPPLGWLEVHPENYFGGGLHRHVLEEISACYPLSFHAVGLSLGSAAPVEGHSLRQLAALTARFAPLCVSDHAAWSASGNVHLGDLLPLPYTKESLAVLSANIMRTQDCLGRAILIENPSTYTAFRHSEMSEPEFLIETAARAGCGLLLDVNNVYVQAYNHGLDPFAWIAALPPALVGEIHLAGHTRRQFPEGALLVDTHSSPVCREVWALYEAAIAHCGPRPTLIEWDREIPPLAVLLGEAQKAEGILAAAIARKEKAGRPPALEQTA